MSADTESPETTVTACDPLLYPSADTETVPLPAAVIKTVAEDFCSNDRTRVVEVQDGAAAIDVTAPNDEAGISAWPGLVVPLCCLGNRLIIGWAAA